jgi:hypothetical protein
MHPLVKKCFLILIEMKGDVFQKGLNANAHSKHGSPALLPPQMVTSFKDFEMKRQCIPNRSECKFQ